MAARRVIQHKIDVLIRKVLRALFLLKMRITKNFRPTAYPYVTGDSFRALADHIFDQDRTLDPDAVAKRDIVFVGQEFLKKFFTEVHPAIKVPYVLICHNGDVPVDEGIVKYIDEKIIHFFAQDVVVGHEKITPIPIGLENMSYYIAGPTVLFRYLHRTAQRFRGQRKNKIFFNFSLSTNPAERGPARDLFLSHAHMETVDRFLTPYRHGKTLMRYKFVASPPGNAIESCRTWEALHLRTIPIVKDFVAMKYFQSLGLPLWVVKDWSELNSVTEEELARNYQTMMAAASWEALNMDFWIEKIMSAKNSS